MVTSNLLPLRPTSQEQGKFFESLFVSQSQRCGLLARQNHLTARKLANGKVQILASNLDFTVIGRNGEVAFIDCKSFGGDFFKYSQLDAKQVEQALLFNERYVPSGFVVYFRPVNRICYFSGIEIKERGAGSRFSAKDGMYLGKWDNFDLKLIMRTR